ARAPHLDRDELGRAFAVAHQLAREHRSDLGCRRVEGGEVAACELMPDGSAWASVRLSSGARTAASVTIKASMVAIFGSIIPAPLAHPAIVTSAPPRRSCAEAVLGRVSVVMIARAKSSSPSAESAPIAWRIPARYFSSS